MNKAIAQLDFQTLMRLFPRTDALEGDCVCVVLPAAEFRAAEIFRQLGERLWLAKIGSLEQVSVAAGSNCLWAFYNCPSAPAALPRVQACLAELEVLPAARILYALPATNICPQYWPVEARRAAPWFDVAFRDNLDPRFFATLSKLRFDILLLHLQPAPGQRIDGELAEQLGAILRQHKAGEFDSLFCQAGQQFLIFHVRTLGKAARILKTELSVRGLLPVARLMHRESADAWRCLYSPDASELAQLVPDAPLETA